MIERMTECGCPLFVLRTEVERNQARQTEDRIGDLSLALTPCIEVACDDGRTRILRQTLLDFRKLEFEPAEIG